MKKKKESVTTTTTTRKISFSQMNVFQQCPYRWYLTYAKKIFPFTSSIDSVFGTAFHETLQEYLKLLYNKSVKASEEFEMEKYLKERLIAAYQEEYTKNNQQDFTDPGTLKEYYDDGCAILQWIKKKRKILFDPQNEELIGIEIPILTPIMPGYDTFFFDGYVDVITKDKTTKKYKIRDIKTSKQGWNDYAKKDEKKIAQILLYKRFFAEQFGVPEDDIETSFFIVKRKIHEDAEYPQPRVQEFEPANGKLKVKQAVSLLNQFIHECFDFDGAVIEKEYRKRPSDNNCRFCPFKDSPEMCNKRN